MTRALSVRIVSAAAVALLSACTIPDPAYMSKLPGPPPAKEPLPERIDYSHDVAFKPVAARLELAERRSLDQFLTKIEVTRNDRFVLTAANGVDHGIADQRRDVVNAYLRAKGIRKIAVAPNLAAGTDGAPPRDSVRVRIERYVVVLPPCPDWTKFPGTSFANTVHSNFGCATAVNLGLMVADPADLASGRDLAPVDGVTGAAAVERYYKGETKPIHGQLSTGGSDGGSSSSSSSSSGSN